MSFQNEYFRCLKCLKMGYGSRAIELLTRYYEGALFSGTPEESEESSEEGSEESSEESSEENSEEESENEEEGREDAMNGASGEGPRWIRRGGLAFLLRGKGTGREGRGGKQSVVLETPPGT